MNWGEAYFDHFSKFLKEPVDRHIWDRSSYHSVQLLVYQPIKEIKAFCTIGLSHYPKQLGGIKEIFVPVDAGWDEIPRILAFCVKGLINNSIFLERGTCINKLDRVAPNFCKTFDKTAFYFTKPLGTKDGFDIVHLDNEHHGTVFMGS